MYCLGTKKYSVISSLEAELSNQDVVVDEEEDDETVVGLVLTEIYGFAPNGVGACPLPTPGDCGCGGGGGPLDDLRSPA